MLPAILDAGIRGSIGRRGELCDQLGAQGEL